MILYDKNPSGVHYKTVPKTMPLKNKATQKYGKYAFTGWILYQTVKGTLTTVFIWAPLIYYYFTH